MGDVAVPGERRVLRVEARQPPVHARARATATRGPSDGQRVSSRRGAQRVRVERRHGPRVRRVDESRRSVPHLVEVGSTDVDLSRVVAGRRRQDRRLLRAPEAGPPVETRAGRRGRTAVVGCEREVARVGGSALSSIDEALSTTAARDDLFVDAGHRWSSAALEAKVAATAGGLRAEGVRAGDAVCWQLPNSIDAVVLFRACWRLGAVAVPIHHLAGAADVDRVIEVVAPRLVVDTDLSAGEPVTDTATDAEARAVVLFTSGSSGTPKGVIHTSGRLAYKAQLMATVHGLTPDDAVLMPAPLAHISGLLNGITVPGVVPMKTVLMSKWDPVEALRLIETERITFMIGPPTFFIGLIDDGWLTITGRLKDIIIRGGENVSVSEVEGVLEAHPSVVHAVAIGAPHERLGEQVVAFVQVSSGATFDLDVCREWFQTQGVARFKTPEHIIVIDEIPMMAAGKADRQALRERL